MLKKRVIGVITVLDGLAVQSFGYRRHLPLGKPEFLAENLDRWGADEILILAIDRTRRALGPDFDLIKRLGDLGLTTPIIYGGGIRCLEDAVNTIKLGADRISIDNAIHANIDVLEVISKTLGTQALIGALPICRSGDKLLHLDHVKGISQNLDSLKLEQATEAYISELLLLDWKNEGGQDSFNEELVGLFAKTNVPIIAFGGISSPKKVKSVLKNEHISAVAIGNSLNYCEHALQNIKITIDLPKLRTAKF